MIGHRNMGPGNNTRACLDTAQRGSRKQDMGRRLVHTSLIRFLSHSMKRLKNQVNEAGRGSTIGSNRSVKIKCCVEVHMLLRFTKTSLALQSHVLGIRDGSYDNRVSLTPFAKRLHDTMSDIKTRIR